MRTYRGSFTVEAAFIVPLILLCFCIAINAGISLHEEIKEQILLQEKERPLDMVACMYRREYLKELLGELYED